VAKVNDILMITNYISINVKNTFYQQQQFLYFAVLLANNYGAYAKYF